MGGVGDKALLTLDVAHERVSNASRKRDEYQQNHRGAGERNRDADSQHHQGRLLSVEAIEDDDHAAAVVILEHAVTVVAEIAARCAGVPGVFQRGAHFVFVEGGNVVAVDFRNRAVLVDVGPCPAVFVHGFWGYQKRGIHGWLASGVCFWKVAVVFVEQVDDAVGMVHVCRREEDENPHA